MSNSPYDRDPATGRLVAKGQADQAPTERDAILPGKPSAFRPTFSMPGPLVALWVLGGIGLALGVILLIAGWSNASHFDGYGDSGAGEIVLGGALCGIGVLAMIVGLGAQAVIQRLGELQAHNDRQRR